MDERSEHLRAVHLIARQYLCASRVLAGAFDRAISRQDWEALVHLLIDAGQSTPPAGRAALGELTLHAAVAEHPAPEAIARAFIEQAPRLFLDELWRPLEPEILNTILIGIPDLPIADVQMLVERVDGNSVAVIAGHLATRERLVPRALIERMRERASDGHPNTLAYAYFSVSVAQLEATSLMHDLMRMRPVRASDGVGPASGL